MYSTDKYKCPNRSINPYYSAIAFILSLRPSSNMPAAVNHQAKARKFSSSSTFDSQYSSSQERSLEKTPQEKTRSRNVAPVRSSSSSLAGTAWDVSDQVLRTVMGLAQFTPVPYMGTVAVAAYSIFNAVQVRGHFRDKVWFVFADSSS